ncbi:hypothetical protein F5144DRAFT_233034 [Chaetomium tenue]|uniref:Uncharacterized protein n=1 Tax=Chaetomium tenue TaxID=1854479 RepID=A0ACB7P9J8_9PEZI|nr:hypothetical protein F5144DRAFT_233034 [Chaetomium globosum]
MISLGPRTTGDGRWTARCAMRRDGVAMNTRKRLKEKKAGEKEKRSRSMPWGGVDPNARIDWRGIAARRFWVGVMAVVHDAHSRLQPNSSLAHQDLRVAPGISPTRARSAVGGGPCSHAVSSTKSCSLSCEGLAFCLKMEWVAWRPNLQNPLVMLRRARAHRRKIMAHGTADSGACLTLTRRGSWSVVAFCPPPPPHRLPRQITEKHLRQPFPSCVCCSIGTLQSVGRNSKAAAG